LLENSPVLVIFGHYWQIPKLNITNPDLMVKFYSSFGGPRRSSSELKRERRENPDTIHVLYTGEPPTVFPQISNQDFVGKYDAIASFRHSDEFFAPYEQFPNAFFSISQAKSDPQFRKSAAHVLAAFVARNCNAKSQRQMFVAGLMKHGVKIDAPGKCLNNKKAPKLRRRGRDTDDYIMVDINRQYKFGFAIESNLCEDYISEKLWNSVRAGVIPIVLSVSRDGKMYPDYSKVFPKDADHPASDSFINLADFKNGRDAAEYLKRVASNETLYRSFQWYRYVSKNKQKTIKNELLSRPFYSDRVTPSPTGDVDQLNMCQFAKVAMTFDLMKEETTRAKPLDVEKSCGAKYQWEDF